MAHLEALHRGHDRRVVLIRNAHADQVAADLEPAMQGDDLRTARARLHRHGRHRGPAALGDDPLVFFDSGFGCSNVLRGERGRAKRRIDDHRDLGVALRKFGFVRVVAFRSQRRAARAVEQAAEQAAAAGAAAALGRHLLGLLPWLLAFEPIEGTGAGRLHGRNQKCRREPCGRDPRSAPDDVR
jgi:hypothetical protein